MFRKGIAIAIIILFIGASAVSGINIQIEETRSSRGDTLYVGGSGPGNYTKIQDAIDNASDGDTVFVYDDSSPYYENLSIKKTINLIGENKDSTIIGGGGNYKVVEISADWVNISGFTIENSEEDGNGIWVYSSYCGIIGNNIINNSIAILLLSNGNIIISNNEISMNSWIGIALQSSNNNIITKNVFTNNEYDGIYAVNSYNNAITENIFSFNS